tara:strand:- start:2678 stop:3040 length:363 start_codon:yes stop_codon:yes gene_type:complete
MAKVGRPKTDPIKRFWSKVKITDDCWWWTCHLDRDGYGLFGTWDNNKGKQWRAHRYAKYITDGLDPQLPVVMHTCDNPRCVNPAHLVNGTVQLNNLDKLLKGRAVAGCKGKKRQPDGTFK